MESRNKIAVLCGLGGLGAIIYSVVHSFREAQIDDSDISIFFSGIFFEFLACKMYSSEMERDFIGESENYISAP
jgi:hypothetical protein